MAGGAVNRRWGQGKKGNIGAIHRKKKEVEGRDAGNEKEHSIFDEYRKKKGSEGRTRGRKSLNNLSERRVQEGGKRKIEGKKRRKLSDLY